MNWDEASEKEIQQRILQLTNGISSLPVKYLGRQLSNIPLDEYNPCQNWQDIGPLTYRYGISLNFHGYAYWTASTVNNVVVVTDMSPQRAAAICAIKLLESEK